MVLVLYQPRNVSNSKFDKEILTTVGFISSSLEAHSAKDEICNLNVIINVYTHLEKKGPENILLFEGTK